MEIIGTVRDYIKQDLAPDRPDAALAPADDLVSQGLVDSVGILQLIAFIESTFSIQVQDDEVLPENFGTLQQIDRFVQSKLAGK